MGRGRLVLVLILLVLIIIFVVGVVIVNLKNENEGGLNNKTVGGVFIEFPPLTLCRNTGGSWQSVNAREFPINETEGVYSPTTNPEINYKCFCPTGKSWNKEVGCK